jgi:hypothetical protein
MKGALTSREIAEVMAILDGISDQVSTVEIIENRAEGVRIEATIRFEGQWVEISTTFPTVLLQSLDKSAEYIADVMRRTAKFAKDGPSTRATFKSKGPGVSLLTACTAAAKQFREYERLHRQKATKEGDRKAAVNGEFAAMLEGAINREMEDGKENG